MGNTICLYYYRLVYFLNYVGRAPLYHTFPMLHPGLQTKESSSQQLSDGARILEICSRYYFTSDTEKRKFLLIVLCFVLSSRKFVPSAGQLFQSAVGLSKLRWVVSNLPWVKISFCPTKYILSEPNGSHFLEPCLQSKTFKENYFLKLWLYKVTKMCWLCGGDRKKSCLAVHLFPP